MMRMPSRSRIKPLIMTDIEKLLFLDAHIKRVSAHGNELAQALTELKEDLGRYSITVAWSHLRSAEKALRNEKARIERHMSKYPEA